MNLNLGDALLYVMIWWLVLFTLLPLGNRPQKNPVPGSILSAPENPRIVQKMLGAALISLILWAVARFIIDYDPTNFGQVRR